MCPNEKMSSHAQIWPQEDCKQQRKVYVGGWWWYIWEQTPILLWAWDEALQEFVNCNWTEIKVPSSWRGENACCVFVYLSNGSNQRRCPTYQVCGPMLTQEYLALITSHLYCWTAGETNISIDCGTMDYQARCLHLTFVQIDTKHKHRYIC